MDGQRTIIVDGKEVVLNEKSKTPILDAIESSQDSTEFEIEQTRKKLNLIPLDLGRKRIVKKEKLFARVSVKYGNLYLGKPALDAMGMSNAFYKLSYDVNNNVIAWRVTGHLNDDDWRSRGWKKIVAGNKIPQTAISVKRILEAFGKLGKDTYKCEIKKYKDYQSMLDNEMYYYTEIKD